MLAVTEHDHRPALAPAGPVPAGPVAVLTNPTAGRGRHADLLPAVLDRLAVAGRTLRLLTADTPDQALAACHDAVADGAAALVTVGGDGTVHLALQAVAGTPVAYGAVPTGTGNDFAADTGFPADPLAAADAIGAALAAGRTRPVDLARMTGPDGSVRWFGAVLAAGFDAIVNERANRMRWPRGRRRYDLAILVELARLRPAATGWCWTVSRTSSTRCWWPSATAPATAAACGSVPPPTRPTACSTSWSAAGSTGAS
ncbi:hypothetical protein GCM10027605_39060 [Micromonospora zhanjiangensis]